VGAEPSRVPVERPADGHPRQALDRAPDVVALDLLADVLVVDPPPAVAHDLVAGLDDRRGGFGVALERGGHREDADLDAVRRERAHETPEADAAAVLVHRLDLQVPHTLERGQADDLLQVRLGLLDAMKDRPLAALLVVHDDLERELRSARPLRIRQLPAVADKVTRIASLRRAGGGGARTGLLAPLWAHMRPMPEAPR